MYELSKYAAGESVGNSRILCQNKYSPVCLHLCEYRNEQLKPKCAKYPVQNSSLFIRGINGGILGDD